jgi:hypothetical protein
LIEKKHELAVLKKKRKEIVKAQMEKKEQNQLAVVAKKLQVGPKYRQTLSHWYICRATASSRRTRGVTSSAPLRLRVCSKKASS